MKKYCEYCSLDMHDANDLPLDTKNDLCFIKLIKQAPINTMLLLHEQLKDAVIGNEIYSIIRDIINRKFETNYSPIFIQQQVQFFFSSKLFDNYFLFSVDTNQLIAAHQKLTNNSIIFTRIDSMSRKCLFCLNNDETLPVHQLSETFVFHDNCIERCNTFYSYCKDCNWSYYPNSYCHDATRKHFVKRQSLVNADFLYFSGECVYSKRIFSAFSAALLSMYASFEGFVQYYNKTAMNKTPHSGKGLDNKNFQINWIIYQVLKLMFSWNNYEVIEIPYSLRDTDEVDKFFEQHKSELYSSFVQHWSNRSLHISSKCMAGCTGILIVDGHQKTARKTCKFNNCYDNTIEELGSVLIGCPKSALRSMSEIHFVKF